MAKTAMWFKTEMFRATYLSLFQPSEFKKGDGKMAYRLTMLYEKESKALRDLRDFYNSELRNKFPDGKLPRGFKHPLGDGDEVDWDGHKGCVFARATTKFFSGIVSYEGPGKTPLSIVDPTQVYNGCYGRTQLSVWFYKHESGGVGAAFNFQGFQKLKDGAELKGGVIEAATIFDDEADFTDDPDVVIDSDNPANYGMSENFLD